jgi:nucleoside-diphosphate-sugar epimerase
MKQVFVTGGSGFVGQSLIPMLIKQGYQVKALARSAGSIKKVEQFGAIGVMGDLSDAGVLAEGVKDCETVFHLAGSVDFFASEKAHKKAHVDATEIMLSVAKKAGIQKFIYLGASSVVMNGKPITNANETLVSDNLIDGYSRTKLQAEVLVLKANTPTFQTVSIRPPLIWGNGDKTGLPMILEAISKGQMQLIDGGKQHISTCHVLNVCHALILADQTQQSGKAYFISDGKPVIFKDFLKEYVATQGVVLPDKAVSLRTAKFIAAMMEFVWRTFRLKGQPPLFKAMVNILGMEFTIDDKRARQDLGYKPIVTVQQGMEGMKSIK